MGREEGQDRWGRGADRVSAREERGEPRRVAGAGGRLRLERQVVRALTALPERVQSALAGASITIDGQELHPEVQLLLKALERWSGPPMETLAVEQARAQIANEADAFATRAPSVAHVRALAIPGPAGAIPARLYIPYGASAPRPLLVYFHGGGWVVGDLETHDVPCRLLAREADVVVVSVDYRRAPEHRFPAAVEDALAAFRFAAAHADELGGDPAAVAVGGDSAGGNLAAVVSRLAGEGGEPAPCFSLLFYPVTDLTAKRRSYELFGDGFFLTERQMDWYRAHYLPDEAAAHDPRASPVLEDDLAGLPPAYVVTAGFDPLRDEGEEYALRVRDAGVAVALKRHSGLVHGFVNAAAISRVARAAMLEAAGALRMGMAARPGAGVPAG